jgi:putative NADPH-quinone reductase
MRLLAVHCHPTRDSFSSHLHRAVIERLRGDHEIDEHDLYAERFDPVIREADFHAYMEERVPGGIEPHAARLRAAQGLLFMFPTWNYGLPAILKGYFDRVWRPGVSFELKQGRPHPILRHITHLAVITTYGSPWAYNKLFMFEPNKRVLMRGFGGLLAPRLQKLWLAQYSEDRITDGERREFLAKVCDETRAWASRPAL